MKAARKIVHKNLIYLVNSSYGIILLILSLTITIIVGFQLLLLSFGSPNYFHAFKAHHLDKLTTIHTVDQNHFSQYPPIDAVYTWVNGSDPIWKKKKREWARVHRREMLLENLTFSFNMSNSSHDMLLQLLNISNSTEFPDDEDDATAANRYRDNDELKYSLRSLIKNAPWIHHVYLVTDNQVPSWLNLQSPHITVNIYI